MDSAPGNIEHDNGKGDDGNVLDDAIAGRDKVAEGAVVLTGNKGSLGRGEKGEEKGGDKSGEKEEGFHENY